MSDDWSDSSNDSNRWTSSTSTDINGWQDIANAKNDGSFWSTFDSTEDEENVFIDANDSDEEDDEEEQDDSEAWLDALAAISAEEIEFSQKENERADKVRQMQEWGFDDETVKSAFGVEVDDSRETEDEVSGMKEYREELYDYDDEEDDWNLVESHTRVERDPDSGEAIRQQMVYVDEHACVGCYSCANVAQSTFFMEDEHGRARVFEQWGDDDDTIACAIETCPVDCIHYVSYDELVKLETERRGQNINFKARLVNQGASGLGTTVGAAAYTAPPEISSNAGSRCNNCPSRGCKNCPMFGVGKNPEFERREQMRKEKAERKRLTKQREEESKSVEL
jgi:ferredoxin